MTEHKARHAVSLADAGVVHPFALGYEAAPAETRQRLDRGLTRNLSKQEGADDAA